MSNNTLRIIGWVTTAVGLVAELIAGFIEEKTIEKDIHDQVQEEVNRAMRSFKEKR